MSDFDVKATMETHVEIHFASKVVRRNALNRALDPDWRDHMYSDMDTREKVLAHFADNAIRNGVDDASSLDGWADLERGAVTMEVKGTMLGWLA